MNKNDVIRAWKDPFYRASLSEEAQASLPQHPAGITELSDGQLRTWGASTPITTAINCTNYTFGTLNACCPPITTAATCTQHTFNGTAGCCPTTTA
ncbi:MAG: mersacidin/lichenicidin family type 2 lantibiotic [Acidobacteria bacterium]|nr:MAG: mersacidin/lichenicidin family type 2 lantibiotic [Acidobacteriota bacterium]